MCWYRRPTFCERRQHTIAVFPLSPVARGVGTIEVRTSTRTPVPSTPLLPPLHATSTPNPTIPYREN